MRKIPVSILALCVGSLVLAGCSKKSEESQSASTTTTTTTGESTGAGTGAEATGAGSAASAAGGQTATATLQPLGTSKVAGTVTFNQAASGVEVRADITGLTPGKHGIHIHENGDCSAPDGKSAGDHFNPTGKKHGAPGSAEAHEGDLGNLEADQSGHATLNLTIPQATLAQGANGIVGRAIIVHEKEDDLKTDPAGNSGNRVACGVITASGGAAAGATGAAGAGAATGTGSTTGTGTTGQTTPESTGAGTAQQPH